MGRYSSRFVSIDVDIDKFNDDTLVEEVVRRNLVSDVLAASRAGEEKPKSKSIDPKTLASDVEAHLMAGRVERARAAMHALLAAFVPPEIVAAHEALSSGDVSQAICDLDDFLQPAPSATITSAEFIVMRAAAKRASTDEVA